MPRPLLPYVLAGGATKSAGLYQRSTVGLSSSPEPIRFGQLGAPLFTPVCMKTVNGRPVVTVPIPDSCQPPTIAPSTPPSFIQRRDGPHGSSHTPLITARCRTSKPEGPWPAARSVTVCGFPTAPPALAADPP